MTRVIVTQDNKVEVVKHLCSIDYGTIAIDCETTGLSHNDRLFSLQLAVLDGDSYHFNFQEYPIEQNAPLLFKELLKKLEPLWFNSNIRWVAHNIKFELRMLSYEGIHLNGQTFDTMIAAHIEYNKHFSYSLDNCLKRIGLEKNSDVALYIKDHKLYTMVHVEGKKNREKIPHFEKVPYYIMLPYAMIDVEELLKLYTHQMDYFLHPDNKEQWDLVDSNMQLVSAVFNMEQEGIRINKDYCQKAFDLCKSNVEKSIKTIERLAGSQFKNGPKFLKQVLEDQHVDLQLSAKGNPILDKSKLKAMDNAVAFHVLAMRDQEKEASFYASIQRFADNNSIIHTSYRLTGTDTGRFSCSDPNLQQIPKDEKAPEDQLYTVRGAFEAGDGYIMVSIDYDQMEYRIMADYAGEHGMIKAIKEGLDPHTYVANMMGVDRKSAKTLNFGLLYGMGIGKLALALGVDENKARELKTLYYRELPNVQDLTRKIMDTAIGRGYIKNKYGRRYFLEDPQWAYKMPNYLIQGTGADVVRHVIPKIDYILEMTKSKMLLQVHDEIIFKVHKNEVSIVPELKRIMEDEYKPLNGMNLTCGVDWSPGTWDTRTFKPWSTYGY